MRQQFSFNDRNKFLDKLKDIVKKGVLRKDITVIMPYPVDEVYEILGSLTDKISIFAFGGAAIGCIIGFAFTIYTSLSWPLIVGGKPIIALPAFIIIAFELTILFGAISSFAGFLILSRLPSIRRIISPEEYGGQFVIIVESGDCE